MFVCRICAFPNAGVLFVLPDFGFTLLSLYIIFNYLSIFIQILYLQYLM